MGEACIDIATCPIYNATVLTYDLYISMSILMRKLIKKLKKQQQLLNGTADTRPSCFSERQKTDRSEPCLPPPLPKSCISKLRPAASQYRACSSQSSPSSLHKQSLFFTVTPVLAQYYEHTVYLAVGKVPSPPEIRSY